MHDIYAKQRDEGLLSFYLFQIKNAKTKEELKAVSCEAFMYLDKKSNLIDTLCIYKECLLRNADKSELAECIKVLKIPKTYISKIQ